MKPSAPLPAQQLRADLAELWAGVLVAEYRKRHATPEVRGEQAIAPATVCTPRGTDRGEEERA